MDHEEGEVHEVSSGACPKDYDSAYEWPSEAMPSTELSSEHESALPQVPAPRAKSRVTFRLLVLHSSILPSNKTLAVIDGYSEVQFGRDAQPAGSTTPRVRLKEMEVSKLHATAYWDGARREWNVVDMGSMHGTYVQPASAASEDRGTRLSPSRMASIPRKLHHMDRLTIGSTTFLVHIHQDRLPCEDCSPGVEQEIALFPRDKRASKPSPSTSAERLIASVEMARSSSYTPKASPDPRKALTMLKQSLLTRHEGRGSSTRSASPREAPTAQYVDRSARRRAMFPVSHPDAPGRPPPLHATTTPPEIAPLQPSPNLEPVTSQPPTPLPATNIGHRLLMKQGWEPGTALGMDTLDEDRVKLVEPLELSSTTNRAGLGTKRPAGSKSPPSESDWKERGKRRRWQEID